MNPASTSHFSSKVRATKPLHFLQTLLQNHDIQCMTFSCCLQAPSCLTERRKTGKQQLSGFGPGICQAGHTHMQETAADCRNLDELHKNQWQGSGGARESTHSTRWAGEGKKGKHWKKAWFLLVCSTRGSRPPQIAPGNPQMPPRTVQKLWLGTLMLLPSIIWWHRNPERVLPMRNGGY